MDGVLYRGEQPIKGAAKAVERLREEGKKLVFSTNNSAGSRMEYVRKLAGMGIQTDESEIITSGHVTAVYLKKHSPNARVYVIGEQGLRREMELSGIKILPATKSDGATHVVVGLDRELSYKKIASGFKALLAGADFIATNPDPAYPTEEGLSPGAGATIGALAGCFGRGPRIVMGKPEAPMIKLSLKVLGTRPKNTAIVGDRLDMDVAVGKKLGLRTVLVLTGIATSKDVKKTRGTKMAPDFVCRSLAEAVG
jgi:4-nitrophenyl phosphatase